MKKERQTHKMCIYTNSKKHKRRKQGENTKTKLKNETCKQKIIRKYKSNK